MFSGHARFGVDFISVYYMGSAASHEDDGSEISHSGHSWSSGTSSPANTSPTIGKGRLTENGKILVNIKPRSYKVVDVHIPYSQLNMIRVLQREFNYEVKGTIYVDGQHKFKSFEVRTDASETYSYGASDWRLSFHTHPDATAQKYGLRYFSPPSVDDVMEIYDQTQNFVPDSSPGGTGELSIIFCSEGMYILKADRDRFSKFNTENLPLTHVEEVLQETFTSFMTDFVKAGLKEEAQKANVPLDIDNPHISVEAYMELLTQLSKRVTEEFGLIMEFWPWSRLEKDGLQLKVCTYYLNRTVED